MQDEELRFFQRSPNLLAIANLNGRLKRINPAYQERLGYSAEPLDSYWQDGGPPEDQPAALSILEQPRTAQSAVDFEGRYRCRDGAYGWVAWSLCLVPEVGELYCIGRDITEYKQMGQKLKAAYAELELRVAERTAELTKANYALRTSEARFRRLAESNLIGVIFWDIEGQILDANTAFLDMVGYTQADLTAGRLCWRKMTPAEWVTLDQQSYEQILKTGVSGPFEKEYFRKDGSRVPVLLGSALLEGSRHWGMSFVLDLSEAKRIEAKRQQVEVMLRRSEQWVRDVLDSLFSFVGVMTPAGILIEANRTALAAASLQPQDVLGKPFEDTYWWAYSREIQAQLRSAIQQAAQGEVVRYDVQVRLGENRYIMIDFAIVPMLDPDGQVRYLIPSGIDITERKQAEAALRDSEERLRLALEGADMGTWDYDVQQQRLIFSEQGKRLFGLPMDCAEVTHAAVLACLHPDDRAWVDQAVSQAVNQGSDYNIEYRVLLPTGALRWIAAKGRVIYNPAQQPVRMLGIVQDITARKQLEQERAEILVREQAARAASEAANRTKDEFLAVVSHELRTPLNTILGWSQLLHSRKFDPGTVNKAIATIARNAKAQAQLIEDLLDISRLVRGKIALNFRPVNLATIVEAAIDTVRLTAQAKYIQLNAHFDPALLIVSGDARRLQQIVWNLLSNAIKFTPEGGQVEVILRREQAGEAIPGALSPAASTDDPLPLTVDAAVPAAQPQHFAQIRVKDTGQGIPADFLPHVFERFRQADASLTRSVGGLGLGLAIVRQLTELHGGTVAVTSSGPGQGATFSVHLPLLPLESQALQETSPVLSPPRLFDALPLIGLQVLIVDDEADARDLIGTILEQGGASVMAVASAQEALEVMLQLQPDVLVSDISMPEEDGYGLIRMRALGASQGRQIPAIALTAYASSEDRIRALAAGFQTHVSKPVEPTELVVVVASLVATQRGMLS